MALQTHKAFIANLEPTTLPPEASEDECEICYYPFTEPIRLPCSHIFCKDCLIKSVIPRNFCCKCRHILFEKRPFDHTKDEGRFDERSPVVERSRRPALPRPIPARGSALIRALSAVSDELDAESRARQAAFPVEEETSLAERPRRSALPRPSRVTESLFGPPAAARAPLAERRETPSSMFAEMFDQLRDDIPRPSSPGSIPPRPSRASEGFYSRPRLDSTAQTVPTVDWEAGPRAGVSERASSSSSVRPPRRSERLSGQPAPVPPRLEERDETVPMFDMDPEPTAGVPRPSSGRRMFSSHDTHQRRASRARSSLAGAAGEGPGAGGRSGTAEGPAAGEGAAGEEEPEEPGQGGQCP